MNMPREAVPFYCPTCPASVFSAWQASGAPVALYNGEFYWEPVEVSRIGYLNGFVKNAGHCIILRRHGNEWCKLVLKSKADDALWACSSIAWARNDARSWKQFFFLLHDRRGCIVRKSPLKVVREFDVCTLTESAAYDTPG